MWSTFWIRISDARSTIPKACERRREWVHAVKTLPCGHWSWHCNQLQLLVFGPVFIRCSVYMFLCGGCARQTDKKSCLQSGRFIGPQGTLYRGALTGSLSRSSIATIRPLAASISMRNFASLFVLQHGRLHNLWNSKKCKALKIEILN